MPGDVLGRMTRGITAAQPLHVRQMITQAVGDVSAYYAAAPPGQLLYGDGPGNDLPAANAAAIPLFQRLRIASRACYVTDPGALAGTTAWMRNAFGD
jgi:hypothetical protein